MSADDKIIRVIGHAVGKDEVWMMKPKKKYWVEIVCVTVAMF